MATPLQPTLTEGPVARQLRDLALPMVWGLLATMSFNVVDTFFVAKLGSAPLAAMSFTFPVIMVLTAVGIGVGAGTSSAVSRAIGEGDEVKARRLATDATTLVLLLSVLICFVGWWTIEPLFLALGATPELIPLIHEYMAIWYISAPCLLVPMVSLAALRAMGMSRVQGYLMSAGALLNAVLDPLLIFGLLGLPALGLQGAALATLITRVMIMLVAFGILHWRVHLLVNPLIPWWQLRRSWAAIVHVGLPAVAANVIVPVASGVVLMMVAGYGTDAVAGLGIAVRIEPLCLIVFYALSGVVGPFFGQNYGAGRDDRLREALWVLGVFSLGFGLLLALVLWFAGGIVAGLFSSDPEIIAVAALYLATVPLSYGAYGLVMSVCAAFNGLGRPWPAMLLSCARVLIVFLPLAWMAQWLWGLHGLFLATAMANLVVGAWAWSWLNRHLRAAREQIPVAVG
ncbi:MATE family efflux transporter [Marinimicrobium alkaliphilum]|uniref:MATE family efflux transporter n=1 Tax=Marinimicrobium alkaliphilum TaxID=2202654 RepID=UPI000DBA2E01|nr:MATE family efflux transporter [Marinimicrobium alkaliphilum]